MPIDITEKLRKSDTPRRGGAMRVRDVAEYLSIGVSTCWRWTREGRLPQPRKIGARCTVWLQADIDRWLDAMQEEH